MIPVSFVPEYPSGFLAKKLFKRTDQQPEKQPMGFVFTDFENTRKGAGIIPRLFSGLLFLFIGVQILLGGGNFVLSGGIGLFGLLLVLFGLLIILAGLFILLSIPVKLKNLNRFEPGQLILKSYPLRLGETMTLTFRRYLKSGYQAQTEGRVSGRLICLEVYMDNRGTGSASFYGEPIWVQDLPTLLILPGVSQIEQDWHIRIPSDGVPSIQTKKFSESRCVLWGISVWLDIPGVIKEDSVFCLLVEPEVV
ncbi:MAG: hypothetical protein ACSI46_00560 [Gloeotrichia echinulata DVL01]|nr:hypothetical protein [Gloeotrichia echinulata DEX184]